MFRTKSVFEKTLDKATSNLLLEPDLDCMLQICDQIRGGDVKVRDAATLIKNRVMDEKNPNQKLLAISVLDTVMKNCGESFHTEVITDQYMEKMKDLVKNTRSDSLRNKLLEMVQCWGLGFKNDSKLRIAFTLYNVLKAEGYKFPPEKTVSDMFKSESAPTWREGAECSSCKAEFGVVTRKHHCRACGGIFCSKCTSKQAIIPKFGIEKEVRVCDACYSQLSAKKTSSKKGASSSKNDSDLPIEYLQSALFKEVQEPPKKTEAELKEEEEIQLALALSLDEQQNHAQIQREKNSETTTSSNDSKVGSPKETSNNSAKENTDPDLAHYFNRAYWEKKKEKQDQQSSLNQHDKVAVNVEVKKMEEVVPEMQVVQENVLYTSDEDQKLLTNLRTSIEIFMNRMRSNQIRGRSISNDSAVQTLFQTINSMHPQVLQMLNHLEESRLMQEALQDKLTQMKDARAALDALRADHAEKLRREAEEAERLRQIQMSQKLQLMRQKKQEYLAHQRQIALQRMQEQEAARQVKLEQQKQYIQQRAMQPMLVGYPSQYDMQANQTHNDMVNYNTNYYGSQVTSQQTYPSNQFPSQSYSVAPHPAQYQGYSDVNRTNQAPMQYPQGSYSASNLPQEFYNMQAMQTALPQQNVTTAGLQNNNHHVVATAPPQTPVQSYQLTDTGGYQMQANQQAYPQDNSQQAHIPADQQTAVGTENDQQNLLITFD